MGLQDLHLFSHISPSGLIILFAAIPHISQRETAIPALLLLISGKNPIVWPCIPGISNKVPPATNYFNVHSGPFHKVSEPATEVREHVAFVPEHVTVVPERVAVIPERVTVVPEHVKHVPERVTVVPEHVKHVPEHVTVVPEHVKHVPEHVTVIPECVKHVPEHVRVVPECVKYVPEHVRVVPESVKHVPEHVMVKPEYDHIQSVYSKFVSVYQIDKLNKKPFFQGGAVVVPCQNTINLSGVKSSSSHVAEASQNFHQGKSAGLYQCSKDAFLYKYFF